MNLNRISVCFLAALLVTCAIAWPRPEQLRHVVGSIVDQSGAPVPRVSIEVRAQSGRTAASTLTNDQGKFSFDLPEGKYTLNAAASGLAPVREQPLEVGPSNP